MSLSDLDELTMGQIYDIFIERENDNYEWDEEATLDDIMAF